MPDSTMSPYDPWIRLTEETLAKHPKAAVGPAERDQLLGSLRPLLDLLELYVAKGLVAAPIELEVTNGIGFAWGIPPTFRLVVHCLRSPDSGPPQVKIGITSGQIEWVVPPNPNSGSPNVECRYPAPHSVGDGIKTHGALLDVIARLVGNPLSR